MSLTDWGRGLTMKENRLGPMGRNIPAEVGGMSVEYQVQMVYRQEDVAALVKVLEFRRRPEKNLRLARKIGYPIFGLLLLGVGASIIAGIVTTGAFAPITIVTLVLSALCILGGHCPSAPVGQQGNGPTVLGPVPQQGDDLDLYLLQGPF